MNNLIFSAFLIITLIGVSCLSYVQSSVFKGKIELSNKVFEKVWKGFNYESDSKSGFKDMKDRILKESNEYRAAHDAKPLTVDPALAQKAQVYAEHLAKIGKMEHDPTNHKLFIGENLAVASPSIAHIGVKKWYDEIEYYNFNKQGFLKATAHFTQLIWKGSSKIGCGIGVGSTRVYTVCKYSPAGNLDNEYEKNVSPKKA
uniref:CAP domain-containing protein (inferred by orthology to a human protein) n=1 Tax=Strongyloides venezuelensis TaxID=75913 RepID=A0A0K0FX99_STRVS